MCAKNFKFGHWATVGATYLAAAHAPHVGLDSRRPCELGGHTRGCAGAANVYVQVGAEETVTVHVLVVRQDPILHHRAEGGC